MDSLNWAFPALHPLSPQCEMLKGFVCRINRGRSLFEMIPLCFISPASFPLEIQILRSERQIMRPRSKGVQTQGPVFLICVVGTKKIMDEPLYEK